MRLFLQVLDVMLFIINIPAHSWLLFNVLGITQFLFIHCDSMQSSPPSKMNFFGFSSAILLNINGSAFGILILVAYSIWWVNPSKQLKAEAIKEIYFNGEFKKLCSDRNRNFPISQILCNSGSVRKMSGMGDRCRPPAYSRLVVPTSLDRGNFAHKIYELLTNVLMFIPSIILWAYIIRVFAALHIQICIRR